MALLVIRPVASSADYAERLRSVVAAGVDAARTADFEQSEDISVEALPPWFQVLSTEGQLDVRNDEVGIEGRRQYLAHRESRPWSWQDWIYCFEPGLRAWSWWDLTVREDGRLSLWVDTKGEAHVPCEELWWSAYVSGALTIDSMMLESADVWAGQASVGALQ
ncbi:MULTISPECIES: hypothetical protein [unclassified Micromonospora]|uniref:hypothetical protein n=1 Tax=unclassified Micromonospora TaxID=2617518 RepID=UPI003A8A826D